MQNTNNIRSRYFSELKDLSLDGLAMLAKCLRKDSPNKLYMPKQMGEDQSDDLELDGPITLRILESEMMEVMEDREVWRLNLELLPPQPSRKSGQ